MGGGVSFFFHVPLYVSSVVLHTNNWRGGAWRWLHRPWPGGTGGGAEEDEDEDEDELFWRVTVGLGRIVALHLCATPFIHFIPDSLR
jgi:hypothetical protein